MDENVSLHLIESATILETARLYLRKMTPEITKKLLTEFSDEIIMRYLCTDSHELLTAHKLRFEKGISTFNRSFCYFDMIDKKSMLLIGWSGFHTWYFPHLRAELGYELYQEEWRNKGLMKEALKPIIRFGFEEMELNRIEAFISPNNIPSQKLIHHFRFQQEGMMRQHYRKNEVIEDSLIFSLLKSDYDNAE